MWLGGKRLVQQVRRPQHALGAVRARRCVQAQLVVGPAERTERVRVAPRHVRRTTRRRGTPKHARARVGAQKQLRGRVLERAPRRVAVRRVGARQEAHVLCTCVEIRRIAAQRVLETLVRCVARAVRRRGEYCDAHARIDVRRVRGEQRCVGALRLRRVATLLGGAPQVVIGQQLDRGRIVAVGRNVQRTLEVRGRRAQRCRAARQQCARVEVQLRREQWVVVRADERQRGLVLLRRAHVAAPEPRECCVHARIVAQPRDRLECHRRELLALERDAHRRQSRVFALALPDALRGRHYTQYAVQRDARASLVGHDLRGLRAGRVRREQQAGHEHQLDRTAAARRCQRAPQHRVKRIHRRARVARRRLQLREPKHGGGQAMRQRVVAAQLVKRARIVPLRLDAHLVVGRMLRQARRKVQRVRVLQPCVHDHRFGVGKLHGVLAELERARQ